MSRRFDFWGVLDQIGLAMNALEKKWGQHAPIVEKMAESCLRQFALVWRRLVKALLRRVDQMEDNPITKGRGKIISKLVKPFKKVQK